LEVHRFDEHAVGQGGAGALRRESHHEDQMEGRALEESGAEVLPPIQAGAMSVKDDFDVLGYGPDQVEPSGPLPADR
jgi:hypothetical protein